MHTVCVWCHSSALLSTLCSSTASQPVTKRFSYSSYLFCSFSKAVFAGNCAQLFPPNSCSPMQMTHSLSGRVSTASLFVYDGSIIPTVEWDYTTGFLLCTVNNSPFPIEICPFQKWTSSALLVTCHILSPYFICYSRVVYFSYLLILRRLWRAKEVFYRYGEASCVWGCPQNPRFS